MPKYNEEAKEVGKASVTDSQLGDLEIALENLDKEVEKLDMRLLPVSSGSAVKAENGATPQVSLSPIPNRIRNNRERVEFITERLRSMRSQLEI